MVNHTNTARPAFMYGYKSTDKKNIYELAKRFPSDSLQGVALALGTLPTNSKVLNLGCGDGILENHTPDRNYTFTSIDIEPAAVRTLQQTFERQHVDDLAIVGDITQLEHIPELQTEQFNAVVSWRVLHGVHPRNYSRIFQDIHKILVPNSSFFISVACDKDWKATALGDQYDPSGVNDCAGVMFRDYNIDRTNPFPVHFFSSDELTALGEDNGFKLAALDYFQEPSGYAHLKAKKNTYLYAQFTRL